MLGKRKKIKRQDNRRIPSTLARVYGLAFDEWFSEDLLDNANQYVKAYNEVQVPTRKRGRPRKASR